jgi:hypothetical protein
MDNEKYTKWLIGFGGNPPASEVDVEQAQRRMGVRLPSGYVEFMRVFDGGEGMIGESYLSLWKIGSLSSSNVGYGVDQCAPGLILFGSDGGGEAFGFDTRSSDCHIVQVPFIGMAWSEAWVLGATFEAFFEHLYGRGC